MIIKSCMTQTNDEAQSENPPTKLGFFPELPVFFFYIFFFLLSSLSFDATTFDRLCPNGTS